MSVTLLETNLDMVNDDFSEIGIKINKDEAQIITKNMKGDTINTSRKVNDKTGVITTNITMTTENLRVLRDYIDILL